MLDVQGWSTYTCRIIAYILSHWSLKYSQVRCKNTHSWPTYTCNNRTIHIATSTQRDKDESTPRQDLVVSEAVEVKDYGLVHGLVSKHLPVIVHTQNMSIEV